MAGDWIKMRVDLGDDPAVVAMAVTLRSNEFAIVGRLHRLWSWADRHLTHGSAPGITPQWIDRYVDQKGFSEALAKQGWLSFSDLGVTFPNFDRHNGDSGKARAEAALRKKMSRETAESVPEMSQKKCDISVTREREEERREENREENTLKTEVAAVAAPPPQTDDEWLASIAKTGAYGSIDVQNEYAKMRQWCAVNRKQPSRRRFINWLNRIEKPMTAAADDSVPQRRMSFA